MQIVLVSILRPYLFFPLNWFVITISIIICASILHFIASYVERGLLIVVDKVKEKINKNKGV